MATTTVGNLTVIDPADIPGIPEFKLEVDGQIISTMREDLQREVKPSLFGVYVQAVSGPERHQFCLFPALPESDNKGVIIQSRHQKGLGNAARWKRTQEDDNSSLATRLHELEGTGWTLSKPVIFKLEEAEVEEVWNDTTPQSAMKTLENELSSYELTLR